MSEKSYPVSNDFWQTLANLIVKFKKIKDILTKFHPPLAKSQI
jgi:hypothetical protein